MLDQMILYAVFLAASLWIALEPGPGFIKLALETTNRGTMAGLAAALGMFLGSIPHILIVAAGLGTLIATLPELLFFLKIAGACYLLWLAYRVYSGQATNDQELSVPTDISAKTAGSRVLAMKVFSGFLLIFLHPRTTLLYASFLPLFLQTSSLVSEPVQLSALGICLALVILVTDILFVRVVSKHGNKFSSFIGSKILKIVAGSALAMFGLKLVTERD